MVIKKRCKVCGTEFSTSSRRLYCSKSCHKQSITDRHEAVNGKLYSTLSCGTQGAVSELIVSVDLLTKGYEVFRALSPACSSDLIISKNLKILRVEVRTGRYSPDLSIHFDKKTVRSHILAIVTKVDNKVHYVKNLNYMDINDTADDIIFSGLLHPDKKGKIVSGGRL